MRRAAGARGLDTVVLAGGVWQNRLLLELTTPLLEDAGLRVLVPERLPPNDGAISFGQAAVAAAQREVLSAADAVTNATNSSISGRGGPTARRITCHARGGGAGSIAITPSRPDVDVRRHGVGRQERDPEADPRRLADRAVGADGQRLAVQGVGREELLVGRPRPGVGLAQQPRAPAELGGGDRVPAGEPDRRRR